MVEDPSTVFVAWTTTPWTLPSNLCVAVNPELEYVTIHDESADKKYIFAKALMKKVKKAIGLKSGKVVETRKGSELEGLEYVSLFDYFSQYREKGCFRIITENFVTAVDGTGMVHCAPGFGEDDYAALTRRNLIDPGTPPCPVDDSGRLTEPVTEFQGMHFKEADPHIMANLKE